VTEVLVVSGTLGAGKTTIAWAVRDLLVGWGRSCAIVDLDALCQKEPPPADDPYNDRLGFANLAAIWPHYADVEHLVIARVVEDAGDKARYERALGGSRVTVVRVDASPEARRARLTEREPEGPWRDGHLARTDALAERLAALALDDHVVANDARPARDVAEEIAARLGWAE
jgi:shikimate kinase